MKRLADQKWVVLISLTALWFLLTVLYAAFFIEKTETTTRAYEVVKFVFIAISAFGVLFTALLSSFNSLEASRNMIARTEYDKIENSFYYIRQWESAILREARDKAREIDKQSRKLSADALVEQIKTDAVLERSVITMFNYFEEIHLSREAERVNDKYLKNSFKGIYLQVYGIFEPWIKDDLDETMRINLQSLKKDWEY